VPDLTRIREAIGYQPRHTLDDVIAEVVAWRRTWGS
jgi:nucleoside-diphosphate-sugar epimerase